MDKGENIPQISAHVSERGKYEAIRCARCERYFEPRRHDQRYCSAACRQETWRIVREVGKAALRAAKGEGAV